MLVLTRKLGEKVVIDGNITVTVVAIDANRVRLGIEAPGEVRIIRSELLDSATGLDPDLEAKPAQWRGAGRTLVSAR
jgi:carbon storage regulator